MGSTFQGLDQTGKRKGRPESVRPHRQAHRHGSLRNRDNDDALGRCIQRLPVDEVNHPLHGETVLGPQQQQQLQRDRRPCAVAATRGRRRTKRWAAATRVHTGILHRGHPHWAGDSVRVSERGSVVVAESFSQSGAEFGCTPLNLMSFRSGRPFGCLPMAVTACRFRSFRRQPRIRKTTNSAFTRTVLVGMSTS